MLNIGWNIMKYIILNINHNLIEKLKLLLIIILANNLLININKMLEYINSVKWKIRVLIKIKSNKM